MGRALRQDVIEAMGLVASGKELSKQVGYNKYKVKDSEDEIVRLAEVENVAAGDVVLSLTDGVKAKPVLKIMKHLFQTADESYVYELDDDGHVVFEKEGVSISGSSVAEQEPKDESEPELEAESANILSEEPSEEPVVEPSEEPVVETKSSKK